MQAEWTELTLPVLTSILLCTPPLGQDTVLALLERADCAVAVRPRPCFFGSSFLFSSERAGMRSPDLMFTRFDLIRRAVPWRAP